MPKTVTRRDLLLWRLIGFWSSVSSWTVLGTLLRCFLRWWRRLLLLLLCGLWLDFGWRWATRRLGLLLLLLLYVTFLIEGHSFIFHIALLGLGHFWGAARSILREAGSLLSHLTFLPTSIPIFALHTWMLLVSVRKLLGFGSIASLNLSCKDLNYFKLDVLLYVIMAYWACADFLMRLYWLPTDRQIWNINLTSKYTKSHTHKHK